MEALKKYLANRLQIELPSEKAHQEAMPFTRKVQYTKEELFGAKKSAVLILFYEKNNKIHLVLIQRPKYEGAHSAQIAFPGGKYEDFDKDLIHTALREANEEVGIVVEDVEVIGKLSEVYIPVSNFLVYPAVGFIDYPPVFKLDEREVAGIIELQVTDLINVEALTISKIDRANESRISVPSFIFNGKIIWGATALMLNELRYILREKN